MTDNNRRLKIVNIIFALGLFLGLFAMSTKLLVCGYTIDDSYHIVMSYRNAFGDRLFMEMWEPHQTSAFLCAVLIKLFYSITRSMDGVVVFLRILGLLMHATVSFVLLKTLKNFVSPTAACLISVVFYATLPKLSAIPEFSNMQLWFVTLSLCALWKAYESDWGKPLYTFLSATFLSLSIISYPTDILIFPVYLLFFCFGGKGKTLKGIGLFASSAVFEGIIYTIIVCIGKSPGRVLENVFNMISGDESHARGINVLGEKILPYLTKEILLMIVLTAAIIGVAHLLGYLVQRKFASADRRLISFAVISAASFSIAWYLAVFEKQGYDCVRLFFVLLPVEAFFTLRKNKNQQDKKKRFLLFAVITGGMVLVSVSVVTNLTLFHNIPFLQIAFVFAIASIVAELENREELKGVTNVVLFAICILSIGLTGYSQKPSATGYNIFQYNSKITDGPAKGIRCDWIVKEKYRIGNELMNNFVKEGESVLIISNDTEASATELYLVKPVNISQYSTICTPSFGEKYKDYFEQFPEKVPDVLIVDGAESSKEESFLQKYLISSFSYKIVYSDDEFAFYRKIE